MLPPLSQPYVSYLWNGNSKSWRFMELLVWGLMNLIHVNLEAQCPAHSRPSVPSTQWALSKYWLSPSCGPKAGRLVPSEVHWDGFVSWYYSRVQWRPGVASSLKRQLMGWRQSILGFPLLLRALIIVPFVRVLFQAQRGKGSHSLLPWGISNLLLEW